MIRGTHSDQPLTHGLLAGTEIFQINRQLISPENTVKFHSMTPPLCMSSSVSQKHIVNSETSRPVPTVTHLLWRSATQFSTALAMTAVT